ncbi:MAG: hypothetical protein KGJ11_07020 [Candidatus Omnitrophica bacterium]|nr:hypothetical protein [Candidatus Omnitrophota bacterium]
MRVLLVFKDCCKPGVGIRVVDCPKLLSECVVSLLERNKGREAFELLKKQATQGTYAPAGYKLEGYVPTLNEAYMN